MKKENLQKLLLHQFPSQEAGILEKMNGMPCEVENEHEVLNEFRNLEPSLMFSSHNYNNVVFK